MITAGEHICSLLVQYHGLLKKVNFIYHNDFIALILCLPDAGTPEARGQHRLDPSQTSRNLIDPQDGQGARPARPRQGDRHLGQLLGRLLDQGLHHGRPLLQVYLGELLGEGVEGWEWDGGPLFDVPGGSERSLEVIMRTLIKFLC